MGDRETERQFGGYPRSLAVIPTTSIRKWTMPVGMKSLKIKIEINAKVGRFEVGGGDGWGRGHGGIKIDTTVLEQQ